MKGCSAAYDTKFGNCSRFEFSDSKSADLVATGSARQRTVGENRDAGPPCLRHSRSASLARTTQQHNSTIQQSTRAVKHLRETLLLLTSSRQASSPCVPSPFATYNTLSNQTAAKHPPENPLFASGSPRVKKVATGPGSRGTYGCRRHRPISAAPCSRLSRAPHAGAQGKAAHGASPTPSLERPRSPHRHLV